MQVNELISVGEEKTVETVIEKSRFICTVKSAQTETEARNFINEIKKKHPFATHNCFAFIVENGSVSRFSDDGEPQKTAGLPMLEVLKNSGLVNTVAVVTRYFGGIKLGAGGLCRAYASAVNSAVKSAKLNTHILSNGYKANFSYDAYPAFLKFVSGKRVNVLKSDFDKDVSVEFYIPKTDEKFVAELNDFLNGKLTVSPLNEKFEIYKNENDN